MALGFSKVYELRLLVRTLEPILDAILIIGPRAKQSARGDEE